MINILSTLLTPDGGSACVCGFDTVKQPEKVREQISLTGQFAAVDGILTGRENLVLIARLRAVANPGRIADTLLTQFGLTGAAHKRVDTYSGGMARRLDIAMSLIGTPAVIFLDEPTTGLDPEGRLEVWKTIKKLAGDGTTILLTTQYLDEAEQLADRIAILHGGTIIANGTLGELRQLSHQRKSSTSRNNQPWRRSSSPSSASRKGGRSDESVNDTIVLFGRSMRHIRRSPDTIITVTIMPIMFMLLFVYVFGGAIHTGTDNYVNYLLPGILLIAIASGISYTAMRIFTDTQTGILARLHSMPVSRSSVLWGHVLTSLVSNAISLVIIIAVALLMGFRSDADPAEWLAVAGILALFTLALTWLAVIPGLTAKTVDGAAAFSYPLILLPFLSSAFVPTDTMPTPVRVFAENQPVTAIVESFALCWPVSPSAPTSDRTCLVRRNHDRRLRLRDARLSTSPQSPRVVTV